MPIYEYQCQACGHEEEFIQKISDEPLKKCPECGKNKLQKQVSASAFHLKGDGWYVTDFRDKKGDKKEGKSSKADAKPKSDSKQKKAPKKPKTSEK